MSQKQNKHTKKKGNKEVESIGKQWGLMWLKVLFVLSEPELVHLLSDVHRWLLHSKELDQINVLDNKTICPAASFKSLITRLKGESAKLALIARKTTLEFFFVVLAKYLNCYTPLTDFCS